MTKNFHPDAWEDYQFWLETDKKMLKRIHTLLKDIERNPYEGLGQPEPLRHQLSGWWSRQIDQRHWLVYRVIEDRLDLLMMRSHYGDH
jgi:toxin YoeB